MKKKGIVPQMYQTLDINFSKALTDGHVFYTSNQFYLSQNYDTAINANGTPAMPYLWVSNKTNHLFDFLYHSKATAGIERRYVYPLVTAHMNDAYNMDAGKILGAVSDKDTACYGNLHEEIGEIITVADLIERIVDKGICIFNSVAGVYQKHVLTISTSSKSRCGNVNKCNEKYAGMVWNFATLNGRLPLDKVEFVVSKFAAGAGLIASSSTETGLKYRMCVVPDPTTGAGNNKIRYRYTDGSERTAKDMPDVYEKALVVEGANGDYTVRTDDNYLLKALKVHDGCMHFSLEFDAKVNKALGIKEASFKQVRPSHFMKGGAIPFDIVGYCSKLGITHIQDIYGDWHAVGDIDILAPLTGFKVIFDCFRNINEYYEALEATYPKEMGWLRVCNISKPKKKIASLCYLYNQTAEFAAQDALLQIAEPMLDLFRKALKSDIAAIKYMLGLFAQMDNIEFDENGESNEDEIAIRYAESMVQKAAEILELDEAFVDEPQIRRTVKKLIQLQLNKIREGKIPVEGHYVYIAPDPGTMYGAPLMTEKNVTYMADAPSNKALVYRSPHISANETVLTEVASGDYKKELDLWLGHLKGILLLDSQSAYAARLGGADWDGDKVLLIFQIMDNEYLAHMFNAYIERPIIVSNIKASAPVESLVTHESLVKYTMATMGNRTGKLTNIATFLHALRSQFGNNVNTDINGKSIKIANVDHALAIMSMMIGAEIDYVKTFQRPDLPEYLEDLMGYKPYWLATMKGSVNKRTVKIDCAMQRLFDDVNTINTEFQNDLHIDEFDARSGMNVALANKLREYRDQDVLLEVKHILPQVEELATWYGRSLQAIKAEVNSGLIDEDTANDKRNYIYDTTTEHMNSFSDDVRVLGTAAIEVTYNLKASSDSWSFPWICAYPGLLYNLANNVRLSNDRIRTRIDNINDIIPGKNDDRDGKPILVGNGYFLKTRNGVPVDIGPKAPILVPDGKWVIRKFAGAHFVEYRYEMKDSDFMGILKHNETVTKTSNDNKLIKTGKLTIDKAIVGLSVRNHKGQHTRTVGELVDMYADIAEHADKVEFRMEQMMSKDTMVPNIAVYATIGNTEHYIGRMTPDKASGMPLHIGKPGIVTPHSVQRCKGSYKFEIQFRTESVTSVNKLAMEMRNLNAWYHLPEWSKYKLTNEPNNPESLGISGYTPMLDDMCIDVEAGGQTYRAYLSLDRMQNVWSVVSFVDANSTSIVPHPALMATLCRCMEHNWNKRSLYSNTLAPCELPDASGLAEEIEDNTDYSVSGTIADDMKNVVSAPVASVDNSVEAMEDRRICEALGYTDLTCRRIKLNRNHGRQIIQVDDMTVEYNGHGFMVRNRKAKAVLA